MLVPEIELSSDLFAFNQVKELRLEDFWLGSRTPTALRDTGVVIVLFYNTSDPASLGLAKIWAQLAQSISGITMAAVNVSTRREIMEAFFDVGRDLDNPLNKYEIRGVPTILAYRAGWPKAYYNGEKSKAAIENWIFVLARQPGYEEPDLLFTGISPNIASEEIVSETRKELFPWPTSSREFTKDLGQARSQIEEPDLSTLSELTPEELDALVAASESGDVGVFDQSA